MVNYKNATYEYGALILAVDNEIHLLRECFGYIVNFLLPVIKISDILSQFAFWWSFYILLCDVKWTLQVYEI